jgi:hypothetical protein
MLSTPVCSQWPPAAQINALTAMSATMSGKRQAARPGQRSAWLRLLIAAAFYPSEPAWTSVPSWPDRW